jgi:hypothetical protein
LVAAAAFGIGRPASGYSTSSIASDGCHERITMDALRRVRSELPGAAFVAPNRNEQALIDDVPCELDGDMRDLGAASMILGNRDVDLLGNEPHDLSELAPLHGHPNRQDEHCLRFRSDDEPDGSARALERCREAIGARARTSLVGLDAAGVPDPAHRLEIKAVLDLRGAVDAMLPMYQVEIGRALHTLQDGFSHSYRNPSDQRLVTVVLNYVDVAEERLEERIDGPPHNSSLDRCVDLDAFRVERLELATRASYELIRVTLEPNDDPASKQANVDEVLSRYLALDPLANCSVDNGWCNAPEKQYAEERGCVCSHAPLGGRVAPASALAALCVFSIYARRRKRGFRAGNRRRWHLGLLAAFPLTFALSGHARAEAKPERTPWAEAAEVESRLSNANTPAATPLSVADAGAIVPPDPRESRPSRFGLTMAGGGALQNGAFAASVGGLFRVSANLLLGIDAEYNPWFALRTFEVRSGSTNLYATGVLRVPLRYQRVNLRSTVQFGITRTNFPLYGVPEGSVGPYVGFNLLGMDYELNRSFLLIVNPAHVAIPIPRASGVPFAYPQYRITIGVQFGA